jgi:hypothetical protein
LVERFVIARPGCAICGCTIAFLREVLAKIASVAAETKSLLCQACA